MIHLLILLALVFVDAQIDYRLINKAKNVHTALQYIIREVCFIILSLLFAPDLLHAFYALVLTHFVYWWTFDVTLNILRGLPLTYLSDRGMDGFQKPFATEAFILKLAFCIGASLSLIFPSLLEIN